MILTKNERREFYQNGANKANLQNLNLTYLRDPFYPIDVQNCQSSNCR